MIAVLLAMPVIGSAVRRPRWPDSVAILIMPLTFSAQGLPGGNPKKKTSGRKADKKAEKTVLQGKGEEEDVKSFKAGESDEDDD